jgi:hypothetical protein
VATTAAGASGSLIDSDEHPSSWRLLVEQYCDLVQDHRQTGSNGARLASWSQISGSATAIASRYRIQTPVALDIAQDYDP